MSSLDPVNKERLLSRCSAGPEDLILFAVGQHASVNRTLDRLRAFVGHELGLVDHVSFYLPSSLNLNNHGALVFVFSLVFCVWVVC